MKQESFIHLGKKFMLSEARRAETKQVQVAAPYIMMSRFLFCGTFLFFALSSTSLYAADCTGEAENLSSIFYEGVGRMRRHLEGVRAEQGIDPELKAEFIQQSDWIIAWTQDQIAQMERWECADLPDIALNARAQWLPLELLFRRVAIDRVRSLADSSAYELLDAADQAETLSESRIRVRRAIFSIRNAMRSAKKDATIQDI